jgi:PTS system nitrogen regulatory IIA component
MKLTVHEAADLLNTSEATIYRWIKEKVIPCHRVSDHYRFHRSELLEWATSRGMAVSVSAFPPSRRSTGMPLPRFAAALRAGGIHPSVEGHDRDSVLRAVVKCMPLGDEADRELLFEVMRAREALGSTGIGDGIAIPHVRSPVVLHSTEPSVTLCFLRNPIDFGAIDGRKVHTLFSLVTHSIRSHLYLLSRLSAALQDPEFRRTVLDRLSAPRILAAAALVDSKFVGGDEEETE